MSPWDFGKINLSSTLQRQSLWKFKALPMATEDTRGSRSQAHHSLLVPYNLTHRLFRSFRPRHKAYLLSRLPRKGMGVCMCVCEFHKKLLRTEEPCFLSLPTSLAVPLRNVVVHLQCLPAAGHHPAILEHSIMQLPASVSQLPSTSGPPCILTLFQPQQPNVALQQAWAF